MIYEIGCKGEKIMLKIDSFEELNNALYYAKPNDSMYVSLESEKGYIQAAGSNNHFTVEIRIKLLAGFKHYRLGQKDTINVWTEILSEVGSINLLIHEVFSFEIVKKIIGCYIQGFSESDFRMVYNLRNITKQFI